MQLPTGWKERKIYMARPGSIGFIKKIRRGNYTDEYMIDVMNYSFEKPMWRVDTTGSITSAKQGEFKTKQSALNYAIKIMKYVNYGHSLGVLN